MIVRISGNVKPEARELASPAVPTFASFDGTELFYDDQGDGRPVVLLHGFAADTNINFVRSGLLDALVDEGYRTIALDHRGHGLSAKPHEPEAYADDALTRDVQALFDHLALDGVIVVGYSMGSGIALRLGAIDPRVRAVVAIGVGAASIERGVEEGARDGTAMGDAMLADDPDSITDPLGAQFRRLADSVRADRVALAALMQAGRPRPSDHLGDITVPVLVVAGTDDELAGDPQGLADRISGAGWVTVPGDHFTSPSRAVDPVLAFVASVPRN
jgi:pimeloyl-ACP methyl ester carboxylesterase